MLNMEPKKTPKKKKKPTKTPQTVSLLLQLQKIDASRWKDYRDFRKSALRC